MLRSATAAASQQHSLHLLHHTRPKSQNQNPKSSCRACGTIFTLSVFSKIGYNLRPTYCARETALCSSPSDKKSITRHHLPSNNQGKTKVRLALTTVIAQQPCRCKLPAVYPPPALTTCSAQRAAATAIEAAAASASAVQHAVAAAVEAAAPACSVQHAAAITPAAYFLPRPGSSATMALCEERAAAFC